MVGPYHRDVATSLLERGFVYPGSACSLHLVWDVAGPLDGSMLLGASATVQFQR